MMSRLEALMSCLVSVSVGSVLVPALASLSAFFVKREWLPIQELRLSVGWSSLKIFIANIIFQNFFL